MSDFSSEQKILLNQGKMLPVMEHFYTIQGEGAHSGRAAYFIRLGGCDVGEIAAIAAKHCKTIIITGGEPLMWDLNILTKKLKELGCTIHVETSGSHNLRGHIDWITLSPKKVKLPKEEIYQMADELKVVIFNNHDFKFAEEQAAKVSEKCKLYLQSEWSKREQNYPKITDYILQNPKWTASVQTHKYLNIP